jgi:excisionase family DNA binding protein
MGDKNAKKAWLSTAQAAELLGVSRVTVFKRIKDGTLMAEKVGRNYVIAADEVDRFLGKRGPLSEEEKAQIDEAVEKAVQQYGTALRMLGRE